MKIQTGYAETATKTSRRAANKKLLTPHIVRYKIARSNDGHLIFAIKIEAC